MDNQTTTPTVQATHPSITPQFKQTTPDDLLETYEQEPIDEASEIVSEAEKQAKIQLEVPKQVAAEKIVKKLEGEAAKEAPGGEDPVAKAEKNGEEVNIPLKAELSHSYPNGKVAKFTVDDAIKAYIERDSFNREADRRNTTLVQRERALQSQVEQIISNSKAVTEQFLQGNVIESIASLARMSGKNVGQDPVELMKNALNATIKVADTWSKLTPEQQELFLEKQRAEEYKRAFQRETEATKAEQQKRALETKVASLCKSLSVSEEGFMEAYEDLLTLVGPEAKFKTPEEIQPEHVAHYIRYQQGIQKAERIAAEVAPGLETNQTLIDEVAFILANDPSMSDNDIKDVIRYVTGKNSPAVENLNRKVQATKAAGLRTQLSEVSSPKKQEEDDELTRELEQFFLGRRYR